ncbi:Protein VAC14 like [Glycine soja]|uniref:Protein VAC14 like n=1 Tax=Glycine soja TaxID=3848 RepID=A0A0B2R1Q6_GLYSO|nr:Protein VAC14 like [Glycine soja]
MADALSVIPAAVLRNLADKLYEKRKNAALEVEGIVKQLAGAGDHDRITAVINLLTTEYTFSPQANHRKGGLISLAAATVGLTTEAAQHLEQIVPPVLDSFADQDSRVRYYACEALYNIAKVVRGDFIIFFNQIFDALCKLSADSDANVQSAAHLLDQLVKNIVTESDQFSIEEFIPLLRDRMNVLNPYVHQFLVGWITVLDSVPDIDMLGFLPDFLDGLFNMLSDSSHEIRQQADSALSEFLQEIKNSPSVDYGRMAEILVQRAGSPDEFTRLTAITWINEFVKLGGYQLVPYYADILRAILPCISNKEEKIRVVARETNEELRAIQADPAEAFDVGAILSIARRHGALIVRRLCVLLNAERVYRELSTILEGETDLDFASIMVQHYLILQLLEPGRYIWLFKALYGLLMLLPQQSAAFKILKTRLKAVPSYSFNGEQLKRMPSGDSYQFHNVPDGFRTIQDGDIAEDGGSSRNGINFAARLQQFRQIQHQHRLLSKTGKIVQFFHFIVKGC